MRKKCEICGVTIDDDLEKPVLFHYGKPGTKSRLKARVCQFRKSQNSANDSCLLKLELDEITITDNDCYSPNI